MQTNVLYYGDNLDILRRYLPDASVESGNAAEAQLVYESLVSTPRRTMDSADSRIHLRG